MRHVIHFTGDKLPKVQHSIEQRVRPYCYRLEFQDITPAEFSQIFDNITQGAKVTPPGEGFIPDKLNPSLVNSASNIEEITRVMQKAFPSPEYTSEQMVNAFTYFAQNAGPACIAGDVIKAALSREFKLGFGGESSPVLLELDPVTRKITSIEPSLSSGISPPGKQLIKTHVTIQPDKRTYRGDQTLGFSQFYAFEYQSIASTELYHPPLGGALFGAAFAMVVKVFMPLVVGAVPRLEEVLIAIEDFTMPVLKSIITSIKNNLSLVSTERAIPSSNVKWTFPKGKEGYSRPPELVSLELQGLALLDLCFNNNYDPSVINLTPEQIEQAYGRLANDTQLELGTKKFDNVGPTRLALEVRSQKLRSQSGSSEMPKKPKAAHIKEAKDYMKLQNELIKRLRDEGFRTYKDCSKYTDTQLLNLCIAIGDTRFHYLRTLVEEIRDLFATIGCCLESSDDSAIFYNIFPRGDKNSFKYCYRAYSRVIKLGSRTVNPETYQLLPNAPLLKIYIEAVYPLIAEEPIVVTKLNLTSYVYELNSRIHDVMDLIQQGELKKRCLNKLKEYHDPEPAIQRSILRARASSELLWSPPGAASPGDKRSAGHQTTVSPARRRQIGPPGEGSPATTRLTAHPLPSTPASAMQGLNISARTKPVKVKLF